MRFPAYDIIMMALPRWDGPYSSTAYSMAKELSRHTRVFYVDNPISVKDYLVHRNRPEYRRRRNALFFGSDFFVAPDADFPNLFALTPRATLPINWIWPGRIYDLLARVNDMAVASTLNHLIRIFGIRRYVLINSFNPIYGRFMSLRVKPALSVYQCVDDMSQAPYMKKHGANLENQCIADADFTLVTSSELKRLKSLYSDRVFLLPNAADVGLFRQAIQSPLPRPRDLAVIPEGKKVITYMGNICQRLDYELLKKIAKAHDDKFLLMIGPAARKDYISSGLASMPNVVFTGKKNIDELPAYLQHSNCCIIPFLCNQLTRSIYPLKINEYLSAGRPVVTTNFSEDILSFDGVARVARNHDEFLTLINKAMLEDNELMKVKRAAFSASNSWEARAHQFIDLTVEFLKQRNGGGGKPARGTTVQAAYG